MKVFIGVPVFNGAQQLERCLNSLVEQTHFDLEIVVSDNGSTDQTLDIAWRFSEFDSRIRVIQNSPRGVEGNGIDNLLTLLNQCQTQAFMWAAHDDAWHPEFVERGVIALKEGFEYFSANWWMGDLDDGIGSSPDTHLLKFISYDDPVERVLRFVNLHHWSYKDNIHYSLFSTSLLREITARTAVYSHFQNDAIWGALACAMAKGKTTDDVLFRKHNSWILSPKHPMNTLMRKKRPPFSFRRTRELPDSLVSLSRDGLVLLTQLFPEIATTLRRVFEEQAYDPETLQLVSDIKGLVTSGQQEVASWDRRQWESIPRTPLLAKG